MELETSPISASEREESPAWAVGYVLDGKYEVVALLAETWRSEVYQVKELQPPHHNLIVKRLKPAEARRDESLGRFEREIIALRRISHQFVVSLRDSKTIGPERYFVTEYADKGTLREYLATRTTHRLYPGEALDVALAICRALEASHRQGIVHRDVKPSNVFLFSQRDGSLVAKLADYSISRVPKEVGDSILTEVNSFIGTASYASPEQVRGGIATPQSDLYSWATLFFEMLTGEHPTGSLKDPSTFGPVMKEFPGSFFVERGVPLDLVEILQKNLNEDPALRSRSAVEAAESLEEVKSQAVTEENIERCRKAGEAHIRARRWHAAETEFKHGLELCLWHGNPDRMPDHVRPLSEELKKGLLCAQGMLSLAERQWQGAIVAFESLSALTSLYLGLDIPASLKLAKSEQHREETYNRILQHRDRGNWEEILRLTDPATGLAGTGEGDPVADIRKLALYSRAKELLDQGELGESYDLFYRLYESDPNYADVAQQCATVAFRNGIREDVREDWEHRVKWLEKAVAIAPRHGNGRTQQQLDEARYHWAKELLESDRRAAAVQLEIMSPQAQLSSDARSELAQIYLELGNEDAHARQWRRAIAWWERAAILSPTRRPLLQRKIKRASVLLWLVENRIKLLVRFLAVVGVVVAVWLLFLLVRETVGKAPTATPTLTPSLTAEATGRETDPAETQGGAGGLTTGPTATLTPTPTATASETSTPTPTDTATSSPTPTPTSTPSPTPTPTETATATATATPTMTRTFTPTWTPTPTWTLTPAPPPPPPSKPKPTWTRPPVPT
jgi:serine/threonine protein kinase